MNDYKLYTQENAPEESREILKTVKDKYGFIPNVLAIAAESQAALATYTTAVDELEKSSFTAAELQILYLAISYENECTYCVAAHTTVGQMNKVEEEVLNNLRAGKNLTDPKLNELVNFTRTVFTKRGSVSTNEIEKFLSVGYTSANILDVITVVATKTISNYINHIVETPLDDAFKAAKWKK
jgi:uncharacterized peroxidase-related enzyme